LSLDELIVEAPAWINVDSENEEIANRSREILNIELTKSCIAGCKAYMIALKSSKVDCLIGILDEFISNNTMRVCLGDWIFGCKILNFRYG
jgi:hypothetical protein